MKKSQVKKKKAFFFFSLLNKDPHIFILHWAPQMIQQATLGTDVRLAKEKTLLQESPCVLSPSPPSLATGVPSSPRRPGGTAHPTPPMSTRGCWALETEPLSPFPSQCQVKGPIQAPGLPRCFLNWSMLLLSSHSVVSDSLRPHGLQHARLPCPSPTPRACSNSSPLSWWCHLAISSSVTPFSSCPQSFPASGCFPVSQLFISGGRSIGTSASAAVLPTNSQGWFPLELMRLCMDINAWRQEYAAKCNQLSGEGCPDL